MYTGKEGKIPSNRCATARFYTASKSIDGGLYAREAPQRADRCGHGVPLTHAQLARLPPRPTGERVLEKGFPGILVTQ